MTGRDLLANATPRPWHDGGNGDLDGDWNVWDSDGVPARAVAHDVFSDADRQLIVRAVNEYEPLLQLEEAVRAIVDFPVNEARSAGWHFAEVRQIARDALAAIDRSRTC